LHWLIYLPDVFLNPALFHGKAVVLRLGGCTHYYFLRNQAVRADVFNAVLAEEGHL
jgi:hypothetical protein